jgi:hypothetical protein
VRGRHDPGALKLLWRPSQGGYHMEYGYSCMGYEIAGAMGLKLARPEREVICFIGDGSYMMANSELATAAQGAIYRRAHRGYGASIACSRQAAVSRLTTFTGIATSKSSNRSTSSPLPHRWARSR